MTDAELWAAWRLWLAVAVVIVVVAAGLLAGIWLTARSILGHAVRALGAAEGIRRNTQAIWELQSTNETAEHILATVQAIEAKGGALVGALSKTARPTAEPRP